MHVSSKTKHLITVNFELSPYLKINPWMDGEFFRGLKVPLYATMYAYWRVS